MNEYDIAIRETMEMTVTVEAASREEDRRMVEERWKNGEYINPRWMSCLNGWKCAPPTTSR